MQRAIVVGADGLIGSALATALADAGELVWSTTRRQEVPGQGRGLLDLAGDPDDWELGPAATVAYLCAGITSVEDCSRRPEQTALVNVQRTLRLAERLIAAGAFVVFPSTNLVFSGARPWPREDDTADPQLEYGRQKLAVEQGIARWTTATAAVRLTKVLGRRQGLLMQWAELLRRGEPIHPFRDKVMAPVSLPFVVDALRRIGARRLAGRFQIAGPYDVTYEQVARFIADRVGADPELVRPVEAQGGKLLPELTPTHTVLHTGRLRAELGVEPPDVWATIAWSLT